MYFEKSLEFIISITPYYGQYNYNRKVMFIYVKNKLAFFFGACYNEYGFYSGESHEV